MKISKLVIVATAALAGAAGISALGAASAAAVAYSIYRKRGARFRGKVAVITGGSRGLGLALAEEFLRLGAQVVLAARDQEELNRAKELLARRTSANADRILAVVSDLRDSEQAKALIEKATGAFGQIDILVNNAGIIMVGPVEHQTSETFQDVMNTNFFSSVHCSLAVLPQMLARRSGTIVNIASLGGKVAVPHLLPYTASKFAAVGFSQGLHAELRSKGVHVLTVCPGLMRTGSHLNASFSGDTEREYRWFSLLASMPGLSVSARRAARRILQAVSRKETEVAIPPQTALAARLAPAFPGLTAQAMSAANRLLPRSTGGSIDGPTEAREKIQKGSQFRDRELRPARTLGARAAKHYNQI